MKIALTIIGLFLAAQAISYIILSIFTSVAEEDFPTSSRGHHN